MIQALEEDGERFFMTRSVIESFIDETLQKEAIGNVLYHVLEHGYIEHEPSDIGIHRSYEFGFIHRTKAREDCFVSSDRDICVFPSRLHEKYLLYNPYLRPCKLTWHKYVEFYLNKQQKDLPEHFKDIKRLCYEISKHFSPRNLQHCLKGKLSTAENLRPVEAQYQDEFYRSFNAAVGRGVPIDSKWARTLDGRVDFWIPQKKWAAELLRDHEGIIEHCDRFNNPDGQYQPWIDSGKIEDWIILDCATSLPEKGMYYT